jgi:autotransporter-associated beta strand protein
MPQGRSSTHSIIFDDVGTSYEWTTALAASNVGGLTKKGEGSLTLAAVPAYTGPTKVEAGALYVVEGGEWTPTLSATVEVNTDREGYRKFIPLKPSGVMFLIF